MALATHAFLFASTEDWKSLYNQGVTAMEGDDPSSAAHFFERAAALRPNDPKVLFGLASAYFRSGQAQQGMAKVGLLVSVPGVDFNILMSTGHLLMNNGRLEEATETFRRAQKIAPPTHKARDAPLPAACAIHLRRRTPIRSVAAG